ncbi:uncharacterized protein B0H18DRAFT_1020597 [Fomitopsis serialis]|uniref:uncharacterized protein n=1 Tax=Fomitopsis serialis TaxID=139415 RepID=UPI0020077875|nr:uncharacterized protein B0H18DRAFT_1020597 [Neoantrodia serialis]KAH9921634.1 hypothetical protein B0H18DRAFT_1020597 [Neoantrodia serialis]
MATPHAPSAVAPSPRPQPTSAAILTPPQNKAPLETLSAAGYPFNNHYGDADVVLQTKDMTRFYVHRAVLRIASPLFASMFASWQPNLHPTASSDTMFFDDYMRLPVVKVAEKADTLDRLLRMCYPIPESAFVDVADLSPVLGAALKCNMTEAIDVLIDKLLDFCKDYPLQVFAAACTNNIEDVAGHAAGCFSGYVGKESDKATMTFCSRRPISDYTPLMDDVPASSYFQLLQVHRSYASRSLDTPVLPPVFCLSPAPRRVPPPIGDQACPPFGDSAHGDTVVRSSTYAAPDLFKLVASSNGHAVSVTEDGSTLAMLLRLCYPMADPVMPDRSSDDDRIVDAAEEFAKRACVAAAETLPLRLYFIAWQYGWQDVTEQSALRAVYDLTEQYVPEMDSAPAEAYRRLLVYRRECRSIILANWHNCNLRRSGAFDVEYWSQQPWLQKAGEARFWMALHRRAQEQADRTQSVASLDVEAILPSSTIQELPGIAQNGVGGPFSFGAPSLAGASTGNVVGAAKGLLADRCT